MARIAEAEIEQLKAQISLERLAEAKGVKLKRHGKDLIGLCPFHDDREPSLVITPERNLWHCLGACQRGGSVIDWVMKAEGVSFRYAVELLREGIPSLAVAATGSNGTRPPPKKSVVQRMPVVGERTTDDDTLMQEVVAYYHATLKQSPEALAYLAERGIKNDEAIEKFQLGYANRTLGYRLPHKGRHDGAELRGRLEKLGVYRQSGHEHLSGSLVIPIFDEAGRVVEMYGRKVTKKLRQGTPLHLYLPGPHAGVWNWEALRDSKEIILCESLIDALSFWCAGHRNVTTAYGVEGFTDDHREAFRKYGTERVLIAYDRDEAGDRAAEKLATELSAMGIEVFRIWFPKGTDANAFATKVQPAGKVLSLLIRQAWWMAGKKKSEPVPQPVAAPEPEPFFPLAAEPAEAEPAGEVLEEASEVASEATAASVPEVASESVEASTEPASEPTNVATAAPEASSPAPPVELALPSPAAPPPRRMTAREFDDLATEMSAELVTPSPAAASVITSALSPTPASSADDEASFRFGDRRWRVRGLKKKGLETLRVNLFVSRESGAFHVDTLELYSARQRAAFVKQAAEELGLEEQVVKRELGTILTKLEEQQEAEKQAAASENKPLEMADQERAAALELLRDPKLFDRILADFRRAGVVGEETNKLVGYLAATSRKLDEPLAVIIQSSSAAGKSSLMDAVLALMPEEERIQYSAMTGQSLFYMGETNLSHKILAIVEEEGAERAAYALKLLQSEGELTIASTGKDPATGRLVTQEYRVEGPVMIFLTTTAIEVDEELLNRCVVLTVDEGREQTRAIHELQREAETLEGLLAKHDRDRIRKLHQNAQRLLRPLAVVNPYARELRFLDHQTRTRRDHTKYLGLIRTIALLHQYQRPVKEVEHRGERIRYIEATREDIALANRLAHEVLGRSLDELPPQTRALLGLVDAMVTAETKRLGIDRGDFRFSRRQVREATGWGNTQLKIHLHRLEEMEFLLVHRGGRGQSFSYELLYDGRGNDGRTFLTGLLEAEELDQGRSYDGEWSGSEPGWSGAGRGAVGPKSGGGRGAVGMRSEHQNGSKRALTVVSSAGEHIGTEPAPASRSRAAVPTLAAQAGGR
jgi:DNA primase